MLPPVSPIIYNNNQSIEQSIEQKIDTLDKLFAQEKLKDYYELVKQDPSILHYKQKNPYYKQNDCNLIKMITILVVESLGRHNKNDCLILIMDLIDLDPTVDISHFSDLHILESLFFSVYKEGRMPKDEKELRLKFMNYLLVNKVEIPIEFYIKTMAQLYVIKNLEL